MSNPGEEEEEEEEEQFYESLDRILSSSSAASSTAVSDDEDSTNSPNCHVPKFPKSLSNYDVWVSEPGSIEERRKRLLSEMGLSNDPCLARRSVSADPMHHHQQQCRSGSVEFDSGIARSKSDSATNGSSNSNSCSVVDQCKKGSNFSGSTSFVQSVSAIVHTDDANSSDNMQPPFGNQCRKNPNFSQNSLVVLSSDDGMEFDGNLDCDGVVKDPDVKIKNLDNGKEFVVNEFREDGMWNKVREVGTGRQLTIEEFDISVGHSPIVQELMRRQNVEESEGNKEGLDFNGNGNGGSGSSGGSGSRLRKKGNWFRSIRNVASSVTGHRERRSSDERDTSSEKGGRRSSSATDDSQDISFHFSERIRVRQYGKSCKELTALYKCQEIQAHNGSIWSIKFSLDGRYLASAGEDCVIHVWRVMESERKGELMMEKLEEGNTSLNFMNGTLQPTLVTCDLENNLEKKRRGRNSINRKSISLDHLVLPESFFSISEKPVCSFHGHLNDVLDLSWSKSQYLLSSSMDKTVRLWHMTSNSCLKMFSHSDYVTCIQFNPVDDRYFISGSLDAKVRIWSIPDRQVVDWNDLHEMVTAACYTPDGQCALVGSHKGSCRLYNTSENKLHQRSQIDLQSRKKRSHLKKITGFQFLPGSSSEVLITSADSRIRVMDGIDLVHKFKGFRNTSSQISASLTANGKYVVSASEDSYVYVWKYEDDSRSTRNKTITVSRSYEHFHCQDVSVAVVWPGIDETDEVKHKISGDEPGRLSNHWENVPVINHTSSPVEEPEEQYGCSNSPLYGTISSVSNSYFFDRLSVTWPEEKLLVSSRNQSPRGSVDFTHETGSGRAAWGMVIVTADRRGEIKTFQNFGLPIRI